MGVGGEIPDGCEWRDPRWLWVARSSSLQLYCIYKVMETIQSACVGNGHGMGVE